MPRCGYMDIFATRELRLLCLSVAPADAVGQQRCWPRVVKIRELEFGGVGKMSSGWDHDDAQRS